MNNFEEFKKQIKERLNKGEVAESIINEPKSEVERRLRAIVIAEIAPEKLIGKIVADTFNKVYTFLNQVLHIKSKLAERITIYIWYLIYTQDKEAGAALINSMSQYLSKSGG